MSMKRIIQTIRKNNNFLLTTHVNPDPDGLCSEAAMATLLKSLGKKVTIVNHEEVPKRFLFLPRMRSVRNYEEGMKKDYDVVIILDCGELSRCGRVQHLIGDKTKIINIDHHITNHFFGNIDLVKPGASSTSEIVYELLKSIGFKIDKDSALALYVGILADTGSFRYENTTSRTHHIIAELMKHGLQPAKIYTKLYESIPAKDLKNVTKILSNFNTMASGKIITVKLSKRICSKFSNEFDIREALFRHLRAISGVEVVAVFTEITKTKTKVNFRSTRKVNVARIAALFKGGGHRLASGCLIAKSLPKAHLEVVKKLRKAV